MNLVPVTIVLNGEPQTVADAITISQLLADSQLNPRQVAVEVNRELVPRERHAEYQLRDGDELEVVTLVGGG